jgi:hypothetical protein
MLKSSLDSASLQLYNLQSIHILKEKKLEILENALKNLNERQNAAKAAESNLSTETINSFKRNRKTNSVNIENLSELLFTKNENKNLNNTIVENSNISFSSKNNAFNRLENLQNEYESLIKETNYLKNEQEKEIEEITDNFNKKFQFEVKAEKMKNEEKLREINAENCFIISSLQNEIEFLKNKLKVFIIHI